MIDSSSPPQGEIVIIICLFVTIPAMRRGLGVESAAKAYRSACIAPLPLLTRAHVGEEELRAAY